MKITDTEIDETAIQLDKMKDEPSINELVESVVDSKTLKLKAVLCMVDGLESPAKAILSNIQVAIVIGYLIGRRQEREEKCSTHTQTNVM